MRHNPFDFEVREPADLGVLADLLEEQGWYGQAEAVRWLVANGRWPYKLTVGYEGHPWMRWSWYQRTTKELYGDPSYLPKDMLWEAGPYDSRKSFYVSATEAVWAVIVCWGRRREDGQERKGHEPPGGAVA